METLEIILIAVGLAMDAFAVSLSAATSGRLSSPRGTFRLSFHFGLFQFLMPVIGWFLGSWIEPLISSASHWLAFLLLCYVGGKMIYEAKSNHDAQIKSDPSKGFNLVFLSVATSIDALAIGLSLAMLNLEIWYPSFIIGIITGLLSLIAIRLGKFIGTKIGKNMEVAGGLILLGIGLKILIDALYF